MTIDPTQQADACQITVLKTLCDQASAVTIFLKSGIRLKGRIAQVDKFSLILLGPDEQVIYKHAISTIVPEG